MRKMGPLTTWEPDSRKSICCLDWESASLIRNAGESVNPLADCVAPFHSFSCLELEAREDVAVALFVHVPVELFPFGNEGFGLLCALKVRIVDVLNDRLS